MITFRYTATSHSGVTVEGVIKARDAGEAAIRLKERYPLINALKPISETEGKLRSIRMGRVSEKQLSLICRQFAIILSAGLPLVRTTELVAHQAEDKELKQILAQVAEDVSAGHSLAESFALRGGRLLPDAFVETVRAGEESGALDMAFERMASFYARQSKTRGKVISSLMYPAFVIVVAIIVIAVIMMVAVPQFTASFQAMGMELPLPTRILIGFSDFMTHWFWLILVLIAAAALGLTVYGRTASGSIVLARAKLRVPVLGRIRMMNACSQFANTLSTMLASGLPAMKALTITARTVSNAYLSRDVMNTAEGLESGFRMGECMKRTAAFPELLTAMTAVGEESGSLESTLAVIGEYYDNEVETAAARAISLLEPIIICVLAVFVVLILLAVYLPMFSLYGSIG